MVLHPALHQGLIGRTVSRCPEIRGSADLLFANRDTITRQRPHPIDIDKLLNLYRDVGV